jgi:DNA-binding IclR family transcriptional regulator
MGKAITAFQSRALADQILEVYGLSRRTDHSITDRAHLFRELEEVRHTGVACDREESILGGVCFAAAIRLDGQPVVSAISLSTPIVRMTPAREEETRKAVLEAAIRIAEAK